MKVLVLGGTGNISRQIVQVLLGENYEVAVFNRGKRGDTLPEAVQRFTGGRFDRPAFEDKMGKEKFDAVIDMICYEPDDIASTLRAFGHQCGQIIFTSSIACYNRPFKVLPPFKEDDLEYCVDPNHAYGYKKALMEKEILKLAPKYKELSWSIVRPALTFGIGGANFGVFRQNYGLVERIRKGKSVVVLGDGQVPVSISFTPDVARGYAAILGNSKANGQAYHLNSMEYLTWDMLYQKLGSVIGVSPKIVHIPTDLLYKVSPSMNGHLFYEKQYIGIFDSTKAERELNFKTELTVEKGLRGLVEWWESGNDRGLKENIDDFEDKLVDMYYQWEKQIEGIRI